VCSAEGGGKRLLLWGHWLSAYLGRKGLRARSLDGDRTSDRLAERISIV
jgi:hypothetical protein